MDWIKLLNCNRYGDVFSGGIKSQDRTAYQRDFDRIIFSNAFRRLQSKTQVFPLPQTDFLHTRLTHSLEASCVGRSLGSLVGQTIIKRYKELDVAGITFDLFASVVANACLAHDIGNPPFGHSGESAISEYFRSNRNNKILKDLNNDQISELENFEGNALGFRILTKTFPRQSSIKGGLRLTYATLGAFMKYPKGALPLFKDTECVSNKKYGYFSSEKRNIEAIAEILDLKKKTDVNGAWYRHPLTFLVEAADDICYMVMDLEDGVKLNLLQFKQVEEFLKAILSDFNSVKYAKIIDEREKLSYLRSKVISELISQVAEFFLDNEKSIMNCRYDNYIMSEIRSSSVLKEIHKVSIEKIYEYRKVIEIDAAGFEILYGLLDTFLNAALGERTYKNLNNIKLIPNQFLTDDVISADGRYEIILNVAQFISGMTDTFALNTYKILKGITIPVY
ncbi:MAG TPA: dNTP triphosphohydrolase [Victivallales bacterium]|nr:dNTP triphosphohydrolase [Victivallales bacterium]